MKKTKLPTTWNLKSLYKNDNDPQIKKDLIEAEKEIMNFVEKWQNNELYLKDPETLKEALDQYNDLEHSIGFSKGYGYYLGLRLAQEENNTKLKAASIKLKDQVVKLANEIEFFTIRLSKVSPEMQKLFLNSMSLSQYRQFLKRLFDNEKYLLSEPEEKIMNLKGAPAHSYWIDMTSGLLSEETRLTTGENGKKRDHSMSELMSLTTSSKKKVRDEAAKALNDIFRNYAKIAEHEINAILDNKKINDNLRGFNRPDLSRHISDDIETEVVDTMTETVAKAYKLSHRYYKLKAKLLKVKKLAYHERNVAYGPIDKKINYEQSVNIISKVLTNLDQEFSNIFNQFVNNGQIDVFPKKGRSDGAFCAHDLPTLPTFILLNHNNKLQDTLTLAHEVGHGINNELIKKTQPAVYFGTSLATAEVASTFIEDFVLQELTKEANEEMILALKLAKLNDDISTIFRQVACYRFEQELHQTFINQGYLSKETIGSIFKKHMKSYMGQAVDQSPGSENWWVYWSHIRNFFYVYSYASGLLISKSMQAEVKKDVTFIEKVKIFLSAGLSDSPKNIFKQLGIDITKESFWLKGIKEIEEDLILTEKLAKKLKKI